MVDHSGYKLFTKTTGQPESGYPSIFHQSMFPDIGFSFLCADTGWNRLFRRLNGIVFYRYRVEEGHRRT